MVEATCLCAPVRICSLSVEHAINSNSPLHPTHTHFLAHTLKSCTAEPKRLTVRGSSCMHQCSSTMQNLQSFMLDWLEGTMGTMLPPFVNHADGEQKYTMIEAKIDTLLRTNVWNNRTKRLHPLATDLFIQIMIKIDVVINPTSSLGCDFNELHCLTHADFQQKNNLPTELEWQPSPLACCRGLC